MVGAEGYLHLITHKDTPQSVGSSGRWIGPSQRPLPDNTQHSQQTEIHAPGGIRTCNPSRRSATHPRLRPLGHWDRLINVINQRNALYFHSRTAVPFTLPRHFYQVLYYKVVQIWPGQTVTCLQTNSPGHIWTTLYIMYRSTLHETCSLLPNPSNCVQGFKSLLFESFYLRFHTRLYDVFSQMLQFEFFVEQN